MKKENTELKEAQEKVLFERMLVASRETSVSGKESIYHSGEGGLNLGIVMNSIGNYIEHCFGIDDNPLHHLRCRFLKFDWHYFSEEDLIRQQSISNVIADMDYVWASVPHFCQNGIAAAVTKNRFKTTEVPHRICHWSKSLHAHNTYGWNISDIHRGQGKLLRYNNCVDGTILFTTDEKGSLVRVLS